MKLKALAAKCKREGVFRLYDRVNSDDELFLEQWLGTGGAAFPLHGLPHLTKEHISALFDITDKQLEKISIYHHSEMPAGINVKDNDPDERLLDREEMTIAYGTHIVRPIMTSDGLELIDNEYMAVLADVADNLELYERRTSSGQIYFAVKLGLMLVGVIMPLNLIHDSFVEAVEALARNARIALLNKMEREAQQKVDAEQMTIDEES